MLAHHEALMVVQIAGPVGLSGWAAVIGARWYSLTRRSGSTARTDAPAGGGSSPSDAR